jgi:hypothetical protein
MRLRLALLLLLAPLVLAACGGGGGGGGGDEPASQSGGSGAATVAPSGAELFVSANTDFQSDQWQNLEVLADRFPALKKALEDPDFQRDRDALGPEVALLVLRLQDFSNDAFIGLTQTSNEAKLRQLLERDRETPAVVEEIAGWQAFADKRDTLDRLKSARNAGTLADDALYADAVDGLPAERLFTFYLPGRPLADALTRQLEKNGQQGELPDIARVDWLSGALEAREDGVGLQFRAKGNAARQTTTFAPQLLDEVPAGVLALASFKGLDKAIDGVLKSPLVQQQLGGADQFLGETRDKLVELFANEAALYVRPGSPIPEVTLVFQVTDEQQTAATLDELVSKVGPALKAPPEDVELGGVPAKKLALGTVNLYYAAFDGKLVVTSATTGISDLHRGGTPVADDPLFQGAVDAAGMPDETSGFLYVNFDDLLPLLQGFADLSNEPLPPAVRANLEPLRSFLLYASEDEGEGVVHAFLGVD